jgi:CheY-like chemotaxis protein
MLWPFRRQADEAEAMREALADLLGHITDEIAAADGVEALQRLRHMSRVLRADADEELDQ